MESDVSRAWTSIQTRAPLVDAVLAGLLLGAALVSSNVLYIDAEAHDSSFRAPDAAGLAIGLACAVLPLALRRRVPLVALAACTAGFLLSRLVFKSDETAITSIVLSLAVYSAAAHGHPRWRSWVCGASLVAVMAVVSYEATSDIPSEMPTMLPVALLTLVLLNFALFCAMWALGSALGSRRRRAEELLHRTIELEHEREASASRAVFDERVRIARELHDVVAHHVSMMGVQAGAARVVIGRDPAKATDALASIEASSRQAVVELHGLLGFLRRDGESDDLAPQPGLAELATLAATMSDSALTVDVCIEGEQRQLAPTLDVSAYRIVQEALTNTLKHAGASRADVRLHYRPGAVHLEITDDGRSKAVAPTGPGGLGLIGMRERAGLHGGVLSAGPIAGGGYAVRVTLPTPAGAR
jgi:signal transduction histidine kinase